MLLMHLLWPFSYPLTPHWCCLSCSHSSFKDHTQPPCKVEHNYNILYVLALSPFSMLVLEVITTWPFPINYLLYAIGGIDNLDYMLMKFNLGNVEPWLHPSITFQILMGVKNLSIWQSIKDEGYLLIPCFPLSEEVRIPIVNPFSYYLIHLW